MTEQPRIRRPPPSFRLVEVVGVERLGARLIRVAFDGAALEGLDVTEPAASVRLLLPLPGTSDLVMPEWTGNEFLLPGGVRPAIRTFTPGPLPRTSGPLELDFVIHGHGVASAWAERARPGLPAAVSGPGRGYTVEAGASGFLLAGDESALPAIRQLLGLIAVPVEVHVEVAAPDGRLDAFGSAITWHDAIAGAAPGSALVEAVSQAAIDGGTRVWVAGEAAAVQRVRRHLFEERGLPRTQCTVRGYWKHGRAGDDE